MKNKENEAWERMFKFLIVMAVIGAVILMFIGV